MGAFRYDEICRGGGLSHCRALSQGEGVHGLKGVPCSHFHGKSEWIYKEGGIALLAVGSMVKTAVTVRDALKEKGLPVSLVNVRFVKPFDKEW